MGIGLAWKLIKLNTLFYSRRYHVCVGRDSYIFGQQEFTGGEE
jgi:hypothetical protein